MVISIDWVSVVWTFYILYKTLQLSEIPVKKKGGGHTPPSTQSPFDSPMKYFKSIKYWVTTTTHPF